MGLRGLARMVVHFGHDRVERPVDLFGPVDGGINQIERGQLTGPHQRRAPNRIEPGELVVSHRHPLLPLLRHPLCGIASLNRR